MRMESKAFGGDWVIALDAFTRDVEKLTASPVNRCDEGLLRRVVGASVTSEVARAYYVRPTGQTTWCGPLGERAFPTLQVPSALAADSVVLFSEPSLQSLPLRAIMRRNDIVVLGELDPQVLARLELVAAPNLRAWDRDLSIRGGSQLPWLRSAAAPIPSVVSR